MEESGGALDYGDGGAWDLTRIKGSPASIEDIRSLLTLVDIDCGAGAESCGGRKRLLDRNRCQLTDIWSGSMSVRYFGVCIDVSWGNQCP